MFYNLVVTGDRLDGTSNDMRGAELLIPRLFTVHIHLPIQWIEGVPMNRRLKSLQDFMFTSENARFQLPVLCSCLFGLCMACGRFCLDIDWKVRLLIEGL